MKVMQTVSPKNPLPTKLNPESPFPISTYTIQSYNVPVQMKGPQYLGTHWLLTHNDNFHYAPSHKKRVLAI